MTDNILVLFGTETGNAQAIAKTIHTKIIKKYPKAKLYSAKRFSTHFDLLQTGFLFMVCSTTGEGEVPIPVRKLKKYLSKQKPDLSHLKYAFLALGDSNYDDFCGGGKKIIKLLNKCKATSFYETGFADDGIALDLVVEPWLEGFPQALDHAISLFKDSETPAISSLQTSQTKSKLPEFIKPDWEIKYFQNSNCTTKHLRADHVALHSKYLSEITDLSYTSKRPVCSLPCTPSFDPNKLFFSKCSSSRILTHESTPGHVIIEISFVPEFGFDMPLYKSGDIFGIFPENDPKDVEKLFQFLQVTQKSTLFQLFENNPLEQIHGDETPIRTISNELYQDQNGRNDSTSQSLDISSKTFIPKTNVVTLSSDNPITFPFSPNPITLDYLFTFCLDIMDPKQLRLKRFFRTLMEYVQDPKDKSNCESFLLNPHFLEEKILRPRLSILEILQTFCPSLKIPISHFIQLLPTQKPRYYSVVSCPSDKSLKFCFNVVTHQPKSSPILRKGVCSHYLESISKNKAIFGNVLMFAKSSPSKFWLPNDTSIPLILVGSGTAFAPLLSFLYELVKRKPLDRNPIYLYFGCRWAEYDQIYKSEVEQFISQGIISHYRVAFSRSPSNFKFKYVQHLIDSDSSMVGKLIVQDKATILICGRQQMASGVESALQAALVPFVGTEAGSRTALQTMKSTGRLLKDVWV